MTRNFTTAFFHPALKLFPHSALSDLIQNPHTEELARAKQMILLGTMDFILCTSQ